MTPANQAHADAVSAAQRRLKRAVQFVNLTARKPLFSKVLRLDGGRRVKVELVLPGPVLIQFDPTTGEILTRSKPGQLDVLDPAFLSE